MSIKIQLTTLLQIFCEFEIYFKVMFKPFKGPDYQGDIFVARLFFVEFLNE